ncbi:MAG: ASPIC/UnbV domain-containing protein [Roseibacillus sp.]|nr:ASPIC/UnbV domain-containing protein [Roseibacillus sp.]
MEPSSPLAVLSGFGQHPHPALSVADVDGDGLEGLHVCVRWGKNLLLRNRGEGYAAQNSAVLIIGLGGAESVDWARVSWPSGKTSEIAGPIAAERELIVRERPE